MNEQASQPGDELSLVQRWFQSVIAHPEGVDAGAASTAARILPDVSRVDQVIAPSSQLSAAERLGVYANAFYARLVECLGESFPSLKRTLGDEVFSSFAMGYLQVHPSKSYTLNELGAKFPLYLSETRPAREGSQPDWADFLIELAILERAIEEVFDGPGIERSSTLTVERLQAIPPSQWPSLRLKTAPCLRLFAFQFPLNAYFTSARQGDSQLPDMPAPRDTWLAVTRRDYIVRRIDLTQAQFSVLSSLQRGTDMERAIAAAEAWLPDDDVALASEMRDWFEQWSVMNVFVDVLS